MSFMTELKVAKHYYHRPSGGGPVMMDIHPTLSCQNKCYYCISSNPEVFGVQKDNFDMKKSIDWVVLKRTLNEMKDIGVKSLQLTGGGEPLLYKNIDELMYKSGEDFNVGVITNGVKLKDHANVCVKNTDWIRVSLDASTSDMYKKIKGVDNFSCAVDGIQAALDERERLGRKPRIGVAYIITPESLPGIVEVARLMDEIEPDYIQFKDVVNCDTKFTDYMHHRIENNIEEARKMTDVPIYYTQHGGVSIESMEKGVCDALDYVGLLGADGNVYGCCHLEYIPEYSYGNVADKSFKEIWLSKKKIKIQEELCWNCRFSGVNKVVRSLKDIEDGNFL